MEHLCLIVQVLPGCGEVTNSDVAASGANSMKDATIVGTGSALVRSAPQCFDNRNPLSVHQAL